MPRLSLFALLLSLLFSPSSCTCLCYCCCYVTRRYVGPFLRSKAYLGSISTWVGRGNPPLFVFVELRRRIATTISGSEFFHVCAVSSWICISRRPKCTIIHLTGQTAAAATYKTAMFAKSRRKCAYVVRHMHLLAYLDPRGGLECIFANGRRSRKWYHYVVLPKAIMRRKLCDAAAIF